jgi:signal transduction histidine kinase
MGFMNSFAREAPAAADTRRGGPGAVRAGAAAAAGGQPALQRLEQHARRRRGLWRIKLWDTGAGIAHERQQTFFQGISRHGTVEGFGLELAEIHRLSQVLGHPIGMASRSGKGSVFWVELAP